MRILIVSSLLWHIGGGSGGWATPGAWTRPVDAGQGVGEEWVLAVGRVGVAGFLVRGGVRRGNRPAVTLPWSVTLVTAVRRVTLGPSSLGGDQAPGAGVLGWGAAAASVAATCWAPRGRGRRGARRS